MQHTLKTESGEYLVAAVQEIADEYFINKIGCLRYKKSVNGFEESGPVMSTIDKYLGDYEIIGIYPGITEEQMAAIVKPFYCNGQLLGYENYLFPSEYVNYASESFASLLEANRIYEVNPYVEPDHPIINNFDDDLEYQMAVDEYTDLVKEWQQAEERTSKFKLILKKL